MGMAKRYICDGNNNWWGRLRVLEIERCGVYDKTSVVYKVYARRGVFTGGEKKVHWGMSRVYG